MSDIEIFDLIKNQQFEKLNKLIATNKNINFDIRDNNYNYFINYIVNLNQHAIL